MRSCSIPCWTFEHQAIECCTGTGTSKNCQSRLDLVDEAVVIPEEAGDAVVAFVLQNSFAQVQHFIILPADVTHT